MYNWKNKNVILALALFLTSTHGSTDKKMMAKTEKVEIAYKGKQVTARKLTVTSELKIDIDVAWAKVNTSKLLVFIAAGKVKFKPINGVFPEIWKEGDTVSTKMFVYGFIPFGGVHSLYFEKIDPATKVLQTRERDDVVKMWNHKISLKKMTDNLIIYQDEVVIYGGMLTAFITAWAKSFYIHRQKRWQLVATSPRLVE